MMLYLLVWVQASLLLSLLTGHGDQRDVPSKNSEGSGGWSHSWDEGTGGHHRVHQAGADSKCCWQTEPLLSGPLRVKRWASAQSWLINVQGYLCLLFLNNAGELFVLFSLLSFSSVPPASPVAPAGFPQALIRVWAADTAVVRNEDFKSLFLCNLLLIPIRGPPAWKEA